MAKTRLSTKALYVERGYGQVEPNHLSAQRNGQIYAQLPADPEIDVLENGQFVKYDYASGVVNFGGGSYATGEWMLVFNEVKLYRDHLDYNDFAMKKEDYMARVYSPVGAMTGTAQARDYSNVVTPADPYEPDSTANPFTITQWETPKAMPTKTIGEEPNQTVLGAVMTPRVFKTSVGDIYTTNTIADATVALGDTLTPNAYGYLAVVTGQDATDAPMLWEVVKLYTLPDRQKAAKLMRIK